MRVLRTVWIISVFVLAVLGAPGQGVIPNQYIVKFPLSQMSVASTRQFTLEPQSMKALSQLYSTRLKSIVPKDLVVLKAFRGEQNDHVLVNATAASAQLLARNGAEVHPNVVVKLTGVQEGTQWNLPVSLLYSPRGS
jgi:hypothetical protein